MNTIVSYLLDTNAFKICPNNKPFWYTSGKIGPYFINAQFLYGSETDANLFLDFINSELENSDKLDIPKNIFEKVKFQYESNPIYMDVINKMKDYIENNINIDEIDFVSGGERRDWYFSNIIAYLLEKPHITIFKDLSTVASSYDFSSSYEITDLKNKKILHVADLLNQASSYIRAWIPAIESLGGKICWSMVAVDRMQGGKQKLEDLDVHSFAMFEIKPYLFSQIHDMGLINDLQLKMLNDFYNNPDDTMREFLISHPEFIKDALNSDEKSAKRAKLCIDNNLYNL